MTIKQSNQSAVEPKPRSGLPQSHHVQCRPVTLAFDFENVVVGAPGSFNLMVEIIPDTNIEDTKDINNITAELVSTPDTNVVIDGDSTFLTVVEEATLVPDAGPTFTACNSAIVFSPIFEATDAFEDVFGSIPIF